MPATAASTAKGRATRERLLRAAQEEALRNHGHVELVPVAEAAGVVPSVLYRYFGSKGGLVAALVEDFFDRLHDEVLDLDLSGRGDWATRERERVELGVRFHYREPLAGVVYVTLAREPAVAAAYAQRILAVIDACARNIRRAQRRGELGKDIDARLAGAAMFGAMQLTLVEVLGRRRRPPERRVSALLWAQVAASVGLPADAGEDREAKEP